MFTKYSAAIIPLLLLICGCNDNEQLQERHLAVTSMDIDDPDGEPLKKWVGKYNGRYDPDLSAIIELDSNIGGEVLFSHENYNLVSADIENSGSESGFKVWAWYRKSVSEEMYSLEVSYRGYPGDNKIHSELVLGDVPAGQLVDKDFLAAKGLLPEISGYEFDHISMEDFVMSESASITACYTIMHAVTMKYIDMDHGYSYIIDPKTVLIRHNTLLDFNMLKDVGNVFDFDGHDYQFFYFSGRNSGKEAVYLIEDIEVELYYNIKA